MRGQNLQLLAIRVASVRLLAHAPVSSAFVGQDVKPSKNVQVLPKVQDPQVPSVDPSSNEARDEGAMALIEECVLKPKLQS